MPIISQFYGIIVPMYFKDIQKHYLEHIHVQYNEYDAVYSINDSKVLEGKIPQKQHKLVVAWMEIHKDELKALWEVSQKDGEIFKIETYTKNTLSIGSSIKLILTFSEN